jgi:hypothetical protein
MPDDAVVRSGAGGGVATRTARLVAFDTAYAPPDPALAPRPAALRHAALHGRHLARRIAAFVLDSCLLSLLIFVGAAVLSLLLGPAVRFTPDAAEAPGAVVFDPRVMQVTALAGIATGCAYFCICWLLLGATPAQRLFGLEVRDRDGGARVTLGRAVTRWVALGAPLWIVSSIVSGWVGLAAAMGMSVWVVCLLVATARSATGLGPHDRLSGTRVVRVERGGRAATRRARHVR